MLSPPLARFISRDPLPQNGKPDVLFDNNAFGRWLTMMRNLYGYVGNNPVNTVDPSGLKPNSFTYVRANLSVSIDLKALKPTPRIKCTCPCAPDPPPIEDCNEDTKDFVETSCFNICIGPKDDKKCRVDEACKATTLWTCNFFDRKWEEFDTFDDCDIIPEPDDGARCK